MQKKQRQDNFVDYDDFEQILLLICLESPLMESLVTIQDKIEQLLDFIALVSI
jgi:hypothetical protein